MLLRQPTDERIGRGEVDRTVQRLEITGQDPQQGALAGAIGAHHTDDIARGHGQIQALEQGAVGEAAGHILGDERCGHRYMVALGGGGPAGWR